MHIKKGLSLILFVILFSSSVYGSETNIFNVPGIHFSQDYYYENETRGKSLFLFSQSYIGGGHTGNITAVKSDMIISGDFTGNIYAYFSNVKVEEGVVFKGNIYTLSSKVAVFSGTDGPVAHVSPVVFFMGYFQQQTEMDGYGVYDDSIHILLIYFILGLLRESVCMAILAAKKAFLEQGSVLLIYEPFSLIQNGLYSYFLILSLGLIFLVSVVGVVLALGIVAVAFCLILVGQTSLNMLIGYFITDKLKIKLGTYQNALVGGVLIEIISFIPYLRIVVNFLFMPMLCLGIFFTNSINGYIKKKFYEVPYDKPVEKQDMEKIRGIVLKNMESSE